MPINVTINGAIWTVVITKETTNRRGNVSKFGTGYKLGKMGKGVGAEYNVKLSPRDGWQLLAKNTRIR
tara:strand:+ start:421 stop:624 length:204 start_codon:yes stop_codon:yes gene_type:complete